MQILSLNNNISNNSFYYSNDSFVKGDRYKPDLTSIGLHIPFSFQPKTFVNSFFVQKGSSLIYDVSMKKTGRDNLVWHFLPGYTGSSKGYPSAWLFTQINSVSIY